MKRSHKISKKERHQKEKQFIQKDNQITYQIKSVVVKVKIDVCQLLLKYKQRQ